MSARPLNLKILTPEENIFEGSAISIVAKGTMGYMGILKDHAPLAITLEPGKFIFRNENDHTTVYQLTTGFLEVRNNNITVLADKAEKI